MNTCEPFNIDCRISANEDIASCMSATEACHLQMCAQETLPASNPLALCAARIEPKPVWRAFQQGLHVRPWRRTVPSSHLATTSTVRWALPGPLFSCGWNPQTQPDSFVNSSLMWLRRSRACPH